eukprot:scaffold401180_cov17-Prasinocladus_malaysianus.AAC.1
MLHVRSLLCGALSWRTHGTLRGFAVGMRAAIRVDLALSTVGGFGGLGPYATSGSLARECHSAAT